MLIFDRKQFGLTGPRERNMCAGIVSNWLIEHLQKAGVEVPPAAVQRRIEAYRLHVRGAQVRLDKPPGTRIYTAFRSGGPMGETLGTDRSFDHVLLQAAVRAGAVHLRRVVRSVRLPHDPRDPVVLHAEGDEYEADGVVGAFGVNSRTSRAFENLGFGSRAPRTAMAAQCEVYLGREEIDRLFHNEVVVLSLGVPGVSVAALIPKKRHVTVSLIGRWVGQADLKRFLALPQVKAHFPTARRLPARYCHCHPRLPISSAWNVATDRVVVVGDAHVSPYLKHGLDSALITATLAADAIVHGGLSRENLPRRYVRPCRRLFVWDNWCGRALFAAQHLVERFPGAARACLRLAAGEQQGPGPRLLSGIVWGMVTGDEPYAPLLRRLLSPKLLARVGWETAKGLTAHLRAHNGVSLPGQGLREGSGEDGAHGF